MLLGPLLVPDGAALVIEAGVVIEASLGASIVVELNGGLNLTGTQTEPVVLTCLNNAATPGCWYGLVVLGHAPINHGALTTPAAITYTRYIARGMSCASRQLCGLT